MKASLARAAVAGALVLAVVPLSPPSQAAFFTCGDYEDVCSLVCNTTTTVRKVCGLFG